MSRLSEVKRKAKIAKLTLELKWLHVTHWYKGKKLEYLQWRQDRLKSREEYLESLRFQQGDDDE